MRRWLCPLVLSIAACGSSPPSKMLTNGVAVKIPGCSYAFTTPIETTPPSKDDGRVGAMPAPRSIHVSYVGDPTTSAAVAWNTDFDTTGTTLEWGPTAAYGTKTAGFSFAYPTDLAASEDPSVRVHQVQLCGLMPGTTYHYRVGTGTALSGDNTFATAPATAPAETRLLVIGDSRADPSVWGQVLAQGDKEAPDLLLYTGDAVLLGNLQDDWNAWFDAAQPVFSHLPVMFVEGNHEANMRHYFAQFPLPGNQQWYSFDYGDVHIVVLDDTPVDTATIPGDQATFLDQDLAKSTKTWNIVTHHKPMYTSYSGHTPDPVEQNAWIPLYEKHHVDLVLQSHVHAYERSKPLDASGNPVADGQGPVYVTFGGGGADPYPVTVQP